MWKSEENRHKMIKLAELNKQKVKDEIKNLRNMDELKAKILGLSEEDILE